MSTQVNCVACDEIPGTISIHGSVLVSKMFLDITGLKAYQNYTICKACQHELRSCYNFRKRCHEIFNLYNPGATQTTSKSSKNRQSDSPPPQIFANPLGAAEITIVKNEMDRNTPAVTFHDEYHNEADDAMDSGDEYENTFQYEDINPQMSDDDDSNDSNEQEFGDDSSRFLCDECSKTFSKRSRLVAHKAEHRNERLYSCPRPGCNSAFNVPHRLTRHLRNVHDADEEEINQSTYALVEDNEGVYVVRNSWLFSKDGLSHIFYPPPTTQNLPNFAKFVSKPGDDWVQYQVKILRQKVPSFELTKRLQEMRLQKRNLRSEPGQLAKKPKMSSDSPNFMPSFAFNQFGQQKFNSASRMMQQQMNTQHHEKIKLLEFSFNTQLRDLKKKLNYLMHMVQGRNDSNATIQSPLEDDQYSPKAIGSEQEFLEMEQNLIEHDRNPLISSEFSIKRERMIDHYAAKLKNISKRTNPKIGLIGSLLNLYFAPEFLNSIGWTNAQGRLAVKDMVGHISLFFEIVNRNTPSTYVNMEEASTALYTFLRRFHEAKNAKHRVKDPMPKDSIDMCKIICDENSKMIAEQNFSSDGFFNKNENSVDIGSSQFVKLENFDDN